MKLVLVLLGVTSLLELSIWMPVIWRLRRIAAALLCIALGILSGWLLASYWNVTAVIFTVFSFYRLVNLLRLVENRSHENYMYHAGRRTSLWLLGCQLFVLGLNRLVEVDHVNILTCFYIVAVTQVIVALVLFSSTFRHLKTTVAPVVDSNPASKDLPTVTVAIPARNETEDLEQCLTSLIASNYPKLEIIVLDDCSQNKRTPEIIRSFAQAGVRFIAGKQPPDSWLAKNYAYDQLAKEANGKILLFCGVDCRFNPDTVSSLVKTMLQKNKTMISLLPRNKPSFRSLLVQPSRYAWELALPRRLLGRPPVLSTCWLITKEAFTAAGGFGAVSHKAVPESYFAKFTAQQADGYSFLQANKEMGLDSAKRFGEQLATAVRTRYPQLHRRPELVVLNSLAEFIVLFWPLLVGVLGVVSQEWLLAGISGISYVLVVVLHARIVNLTYRRFRLAGLLILPVATLYDICLLNYSMWQYEFSEVIWKGRNVCLPVMQVEQSLPKLS